MQVRDVVAVAEGVAAEFVGFTMDEASSDACACEPNGEAIRVMVASIFSAAAQL